MAWMEDTDKALPERKGVYTYADYEKLPEGAPHQLIGGDVVKEPSPRVCC